MHSMSVSGLIFLLMIIGNDAIWRPRVSVPPKRYMFGDWNPHFGYLPSHPAKQHLSRPGLNVSDEPQIGNDARLNNYVVRLVHKKKLICSGIIVSQQSLLTSALCIHELNLTEITVKLADNSNYKVANRSVASGYTMDLKESLLAILNLKKMLPIMYADPVPLCPITLQLSDVVELWSWNYRRILLKKRLTKQVRDCKIPGIDGINDGLSCLENNKNTPHCEKTFGLPYVWNGFFCGMNILGHNCPMPALTDVYVRLIDAKSVITRTIQDVKYARMHDVIA